MSRIYAKNVRSAFSGSDNEKEVFTRDINVTGTLSINGGTVTPSCSTFFTPITNNWKSVSAAVQVPEGQHDYGQDGPGPDNDPVVMYTVPEGRCALTLSMSQDGLNDPDARASYAIRSGDAKSYTYYLVSARNENTHHERFVYMDEGDTLVVWGLPSQTFNSAASLIEFDKSLPDGCFYQIIRLSTEETADVSYEIPANHSAVLCPNLLPVGEDGESASDSIIFGRDGVGANVVFEVINTVNSIPFTTRVELNDRAPFNTTDQRPRLTSFKGGDIFELKVIQNEDNKLATATTALFVRPNTF